MIGALGTLPNDRTREYAMATPVLRPLSLGEVLDVSFGLYRSMFAPLLLVAAASQVVPMVMNVYIVAAGGFLANLGMVVAWLTVVVILSALGVAASTYVVSDAYLGRETSAGSALARTGGILARLIMISLLTSLLVGFGFVFLIVPGLFILSGLLLSTVVAVLERAPGAVDAMGRSWDLTRGYRGKVFLTMLVSFVLLMVPSWVVGRLWGLVGSTGPESVGMVVVQGVFGIFVYPFIYVVTTVLYYDLRVRKEGFDLELLASSLAPPAG
jgi:hypothetical protein